MLCNQEHVEYRDCAPATKSISPVLPDYSSQATGKQQQKIAEDRTDWWRGLNFDKREGRKKERKSDAGGAAIKTAEDADPVHERPTGSILLRKADTPSTTETASSSTHVGGSLQEDRANLRMTRSLENRWVIASEKFCRDFWSWHLLLKPKSRVLMPLWQLIGLNWIMILVPTGVCSMASKTLQCPQV